MTLSASNTYPGDTTVSAGTLQLGDGAVNNGSVAGNIQDNATLCFATATQQIYAGQIKGSGALAITGPGTLVLAGSNTFSGGTIVSGGKLIVVNAYSLPDGTNLTVGNAAALTGPTAPVNGNWAGAGGGSWAAAGNWSGNLVPGATFQDTAAFGTVIGSSSAAITLDGSRVLGSLTFNTTGAGSYALGRSASDSTSTLTLASAGGTTAIVNSGGRQAINVPVVLAGNFNVSAAVGTTLTVSGAITQSSGSRSARLSGGGTLVLSASNGYSGGTTVAGGLLQAGNNSAPGANSESADRQQRRHAGRSRLPSQCRGPQRQRDPRQPLRQRQPHRRQRRRVEHVFGHDQKHRRPARAHEVRQRPPGAGRHEQLRRRHGRFGRRLGHFQPLGDCRSIGFDRRRKLAVPFRRRRRATIRKRVPPHVKRHGVEQLATRGCHCAGARTGNHGPGGSDSNGCSLAEGPHADC